MMTERKLLVGPDPDGSTFEKAFSKAARLPTEEDRKAAMEKGIRDLIREDLHRDSAYQPPSVGSPRSVGRNGWINEVPISAPEGIGLIDKICDAHLPQPPHVTLRGVDPKLVREKLAQAVASGKITRSVMEEQLALLGLGPDEPQPKGLGSQ
jgi:hypothetical protein